MKEEILKKQNYYLLELQKQMDKDFDELHERNDKATKEVKHIIEIIYKQIENPKEQDEIFNLVLCGVVQNLVKVLNILTGDDK